MQDLISKLKSLGMPITRASDLTNIKKKTRDFDQVFKGKWVNGNDRKIFLIEKIIPYGSLFGSQIITKEIISSNLYKLFNLNNDSWKSYKEFLFIDTETSSLSLNAGSFIFLIGMCFFNEKGLKIIQLLMPDLIHEPLLLNYFDSKLEEFSTIVSYNGKAFDVPIIKSRSIINSLPCSIGNHIHLDLLHTSRNIWKLRLDSRKLSDIEKQILGVKRDENEIPGWLVPQMYFDYLETGNAEFLQGVVYHNEMDIVSLAVLFNLFNTMAADDFTQMKHQNNLDRLAIGEILRKGKQYELAEKVFEKGLAETDVALIPKEIIRKYALMLKRNGAWQRATSLWKTAGKKGDIPSCIEIAKYYEHQRRNFNQALKWSIKALRLSQSEEVSPQKIDSILHRIHRLEEKRK